MHTESKSRLDTMPELPQLRHLIEPILYSKVRKIKLDNDISYSEEIAGSVKTVYSSSDNDEGIDDYMNEAEMIAKVSEFLSQASIHSGTDKDMLSSSFHDHTNSFLFFNSEVKEIISEKKDTETYESNRKIRPISVIQKSRVQSSKKKLLSSFNNTCN